ncbi:MAG: ABC transporter permease [Sphaerochaetaceae bacterium]|jgi:peptide/nickel transport system permease protein|nr:ABC transporter permease [Sphaerochaetaceae bacterium]
MENETMTIEELIIAQEKQRKKETVKQFWRVFFGRGILSKVCFAILLAYIALAILTPILTPYTPYEQSLKDALQGVSAKHWLGTDNLGRDLLTRTLYGARISLCTGLLSSCVALVVGASLGLIAGYSKGFVSGLIMRLVDAQLSIPGLILTMCLVSIFGGSILSVSVIIGITSLPGYIRMLYGQVLSLRENDYVIAAELVGQNTFEIMYKHLLPNVFPTVIVMFTGSVGAAVMIESGLAYLGIGITPPTPAWGTMVSEGYNYFMFKPMLALVPGIALMLLIISLNIVGDGLRDALDPRLKGKL